MSSASDQRETYEGLWAGGWAESSTTFPGASYKTRRRLFLRCFRGICRAGADVLDVGCGNGSLLADIARLYPDVGQLAGTDVADAALDVARKRVPQALFFRSDPQTGPLQVERLYDIVTCSDVLEHVQSHDAVIDSMRDAMKPGGRIVISVPHGMKNWGPHDEAVHHVRRFEKGELRAALERAGLIVDRAFTWGSVLYNMYCRLLLNHVSPGTTWRRKSWLMRQAHRLLYAALFVDDLFIDVGNGRMLFAVAHRHD